jgi:hypothetical protein
MSLAVNIRTVEAKQRMKSQYLGTLATASALEKSAIQAQQRALGLRNSGGTLSASDVTRPQVPIQPKESLTEDDASVSLAKRLRPYMISNNEVVKFIDQLKADGTLFEVADLFDLFASSYLTGVTRQTSDTLMDLYKAFEARKLGVAQPALALLPAPAPAPIPGPLIAPIGMPLVSPVGPSPAGPSPVGPSPVGPSPVGPSPAGPSPAGPSPVGPSPVGPSPAPSPLVSPVGVPVVGSAPMGSPAGPSPAGPAPVTYSWDPSLRRFVVDATLQAPRSGTPVPAGPAPAGPTSVHTSPSPSPAGRLAISNPTEVARKEITDLFNRYQSFGMDLVEHLQDGEYKASQPSQDQILMDIGRIPATRLNSYSTQEEKLTKVLELLGLEKQRFKNWPLAPANPTEVAKKEITDLFNLYQSSGVDLVDNLPDDEYKALQPSQDQILMDIGRIPATRLDVGAPSGYSTREEKLTKVLELLGLKKQSTLSWALSSVGKALSSSGPQPPYDLSKASTEAIDDYLRMLEYYTSRGINFAEIIQEDLARIKKAIEIILKDPDISRASSFALGRADTGSKNLWEKSLMVRYRLQKFMTNQATIPSNVRAEVLAILGDPKTQSNHVRYEPRTRDQLEKVGRAKLEEFAELLAALSSARGERTPAITGDPTKDKSWIDYILEKQKELKLERAKRGLFGSGPTRGPMNFG